MQLRIVLKDVSQDDHDAATEQHSYLSCRPCKCYVDAAGIRIADCVGRNLSVVPASLPPTTDVLLLGKNKIVKLQNNTFTNLPNIKVLNISECYLKHIEVNTFAPLKGLDVLDLSENSKLNVKGLENLTFSLQHSSLRKLYINKIMSPYSVCIIISNTIARRLQKAPLTEIHADRNRIELFGDQALELLPKTLKKLYLRQNRLTFGPYLRKMSSLEELEEVDASGKHGSHDLPIFENMETILDEMPECQDPDDCSTNTAVMNIPVDHLGKSSLTSSGPMLPVTYDVPPKLKNLTCTYSQMSYHITNVTINNNSLERVDLSSNLLSTWIGPVYGLENLRYLDLSNNVARNVSMVFFQNFAGLEFLNISYNFLGLILSKDKKGKIFSELHNVTILDLSNNFIPVLHDDVFKGLTSLKVLDLSHNHMNAFFVNLDNLNELQTVRCASNQIRWIPKHVIRHFDALAKNRNFTFDLSDNPIACTCENLQFLWWLLNADQIKFGNFADYFCMYNNGKKRSFNDDLDDIYEDLRDSCNGHFVIALGAVAAFVLIVCVISSAIAYRYRWKLRYWYYAAKLRYNRQPESCAEGEYQFDAFVSFADEDREFVVSDLLLKLEEEASLKLNIHMRDFTPGRPIAQNIVEAVQTSKRTLIILSEDFLASNWCKYELEMANMEKVTTDRDVILIIMYRSIKSKDIPAEITYHIKNDSFIEYPWEGGRDVFWSSLTAALRS